MGVYDSSSSSIHTYDLAGMGTVTKAKTMVKDEI
jgi:hypothetical protein